MTENEISAALPPPCFSVKPHESLVPVPKKKSKSATIAWNVFSTVVFPVGICRLLGHGLNTLTRSLIVPAGSIDKKALNNLRKDLFSLAEDLSQSPDAKVKFEWATIKTADQVNLDTIKIQNMVSQENIPPKDQKWIVFLNPNGGTYEQLIPMLASISLATGANVYAGNYRGVGRSESKPNSARDLIFDGEAMVQYLLSQGVRPENIMLQGWSLGGGVATEVASLHQAKGHEISLCNDRSFSSLSDAVKGIIKIPVISSLAAFIARRSWGNFESAKKYKKIQGFKFTIHSKDDSVIPHKKAGLYKKLKKDAMTPAQKALKKERIKMKKQGMSIPPYDESYKPENALQLKTQHRYIHMMPINMLSKSDQNQYLNLVKKALKIGKSP